MALHAREGSDWSIHIAGAKMIVTSLSQAELELLTSTAEGATLYQSLEYHDVLARFGLQHWRRHELEGETFDSVRNPLEKIAFEVSITGGDHSTPLTMPAYTAFVRFGLCARRAQSA